MRATDMQVGGGYVYQWECAMLLALNCCFEPVRDDPLLQLVAGFLGKVEENHLITPFDLYRKQASVPSKPVADGDLSPRPEMDMRGGVPQRASGPTGWCCL